MEHRRELIEAAVEIVAAYVSKNLIAAAELPRLIQQTAAALASLIQGQAEPKTPSEPLKPAVPIKKSIADDHLVCLEDGKSFKSLKRHLHTDHDLSPEQYRSKWGLPREYPMVAPAYSQARSKLALEAGFGQKGRKARG